MKSARDQLQDLTTIVADTGDITAIQNCRPTDATTNPTLVRQAMGLSAYADLVQLAIDSARGDSDPIASAYDNVLIGLCREILRYVDRFVSLEIDARLSFDTKKTVTKAQTLIEKIAAAGLPTDRILIKIAATWEGIQAAKILEKSGTRCNLTLVFGLIQAKACANASAYLISPFVGRIFDWYQKNNMIIAGEIDPGVKSVQSIFQYYRLSGIQTLVMGASFRSVDQVLALAGCDLLTISPQLLDELATDFRTISNRIDVINGPVSNPEIVNEAQFRWELNEDPMATELLAAGIRRFAADQLALETQLQARLG